MLSALLLGAANKSESGLDRNLESIFKTSVRLLAIESSQNLTASLQAKAKAAPTLDAVKPQDPFIKKRKRYDKEDPALSDETEKRAKRKSKPEQPAVASTPSTRSKKIQASSEPPLSNPTKTLSTSKGSIVKSVKGARNDIKEKMASPTMHLDEQREGQWDEDAGERSDEAEEHTRESLLHETITASGVPSSVSKPRCSIYVPEGETKEL